MVILYAAKEIWYWKEEEKDATRTAKQLGFSLVLKTPSHNHNSIKVDQTGSEEIKK